METCRVSVGSQGSLRHDCVVSNIDINILSLYVVSHKFLQSATGLVVISSYQVCLQGHDPFFVL